MKMQFVVLSCLFLSVTSSCGRTGPTKINSSKEGGLSGDGGLSGGGGYTSIYASRVLKYESSKLASNIELLDVAALSVLPAGWNQSAVARVIRDIRENPTTERQRDGKELMFDYGTDVNGPYIEALKPYYTAYGAISPPSGVIDYALARALWIRLAHEVGHHLGYGEDTAERFGTGVASAIERQLVVCTGVYYNPQNGQEDLPYSMAAVINTISNQGAIYGLPHGDTEVETVIAAGIPGAKLDLETYSITSRDQHHKVFSGRWSSLTLNLDDWTRSTVNFNTMSDIPMTCRKNTYVVKL